MEQYIIKYYRNSWIAYHKNIYWKVVRANTIEELKEGIKKLENGNNIPLL